MLEHGHGFKVERTHATHECLFHCLLIAVPFCVQPGHLSPGRVQRFIELQQVEPL